MLAPGSLIEVVGALRGEISPAPVIPGIAKREEYAVDFREVRGQRVARRAAEIAAAGGHNLLVLGNPGSETMLARRIPTILPPADAGRADRGHEGVVRRGADDRPRWIDDGSPISSAAPHDQRSRSDRRRLEHPSRRGVPRPSRRVVLRRNAGDSAPRAGVAATAPRRSRDRDLEGPAHGAIARGFHARRRRQSLSLWVARSSVAPVSVHGARHVRRYLGRLSGPLLDRIDMVIDAPSLTPAELMSEEEGEPSAAISNARRGSERSRRTSQRNAERAPSRTRSEETRSAR